MACFVVFLNVKNFVVDPNVVKRVSNVIVSSENPSAAEVLNVSFLHEEIESIRKKATMHIKEDRFDKEVLFFIYTD